MCRYVLRHFSKTDVKKVIQNLSGVLKPGGTLYCIDVEGLLADSPCASAFLRSALKNIRENDFFDFQVGRRMPSLLLEHGFENVEWHVNTVEFKDEELFLEIENLKQTVTNAEAFVKSRIGAEENGEENFARFQDEYFKMLNDPGNVHFYNKLIATGTKPIAKLSLVKKSK